MMKRTSEIGLRAVIFNALHIIFKENPFFLTITILSMLIMGVLPAMIIFITQELINCIQTSKSFSADILINILILCGGFFLQEVITEWYSYYSSKSGRRISNSIDLQILEKSTRLKLSDYEDSNIYDIVTRAQNQSGEQLIGMYTNAMNLIRDLSSVFFSAIVLSRIVWWFIPICLIMPILKAFISMILDKELYNIRINRTKDERKLWYIKYLLVLGKGVKDARIFQFDTNLVQTYMRIKNRFLSEDFVFFKRQFILSSSAEAFSSLLHAGLLVYIFFQAVFKRILLGDLNACLECIEQIKGGSEAILVGIENILNESMYLAQIFEYLNLPEDIERSQEVSTLTSLEFQDVSFGYSERKILNHVSFKLTRGDMIIIEGNNGSGKTTLIKLLLGFYDDYSGQIRINGTELREINRNSYYRHISCLFQDFERLESSVKENITCGHDDINDRANSCLKAVGMENRIKDMGGISTIIGQWFGSQQLSGGEWKKLAIARNLFKRSSLVIWDEPDAALDHQSKEFFFKEQRIHKQCITVIVSHNSDITHFYNTEKQKKYSHNGIEITILENI